MNKTAEMRSQLEQQLVVLVEEDRPRLLQLAGATGTGDAADQADRVNVELELSQVDARIGRLRQQLDALTASSGRRRTVHADVVTMGVPLLVDFGDGPEKAVVVGTVWNDTDPEVLTISSESPAGRALLGQKPGAHVTYHTPAGKAVTITVTALDASAA